MNRTTLRYITTAIAIIAYTLLIYKLATYDGYANLVQEFSNSTLEDYLYLVTALLLMPLNQLIESLKWRYNIKPLERITILESINSTLIGQVGAFITPNRLGDFPIRSSILQPKNRISGTIFGFIGSWAQTVIIISIGLIGASAYARRNTDIINTEYMIISASIGLTIILFFILLPYISNRYSRLIKNKRLSEIAKTLGELNIKNTIVLLAYSLLRYAIFSTQFWLILQFCGVDLAFTEAIESIPTIYLLTTITPMITLSEAATRSSYSILILSTISDNSPAIALGATLTWVINCSLPLIAGGLIFNSKTVKN